MSQTTETTPHPLADTGLAHRVLIVDAPHKPSLGQLRVLSAERALRLGRIDGRDCFPLQDTQVSRAHAVLASESSGYTVRDLGSRNGTFVNGSRTAACPLKPGDVIRIGGHLLLYQSLSVADCRLLVGALPPRASGLVGEGHRMLAVRGAIAAAARTDVPVLVQGPTGVGKEGVARAVHEQSQRGGPFVAVNCAALPHALVESELFGHARGAFTGAGEASRGLFGEAERGTLLLDEIGDMPFSAQGKLLRVLATGEVRPVGQTAVRRADVRVIAATNVSLADAVARGEFRGDLYARLLGSVIEVPALRERREDIPLLVAHFGSQLGKTLMVEPDAMESLLCHPWSYNVRELELLVRRVCDAHPEEQVVSLGLGDLDHELRSQVAARSTTRCVTAPPLLEIPRGAAPTRPQLEAVLAHYDGNVARAASFFGKERRQVYRWAHRLGIDPECYRETLSDT
ncbi:MAG: sigma 54-interacting transcriptional regulator [Myxococcales bacterium]|nr:sigma 54-interacting transcriptional regulator [Myxococcales bacterium]